MQSEILQPVVALIAWSLVMLVWLGVQLLLAVRARIPAFDLRPAGPAASGGGVRSNDPEGGEARP